MSVQIKNHIRGIMVKEKKEKVVLVLDIRRKWITGESTLSDI